MQQTFVVVNDEIAAQKEDMARLADKERELHDAIIALQKDVQVSLGAGEGRVAYVFR